ncbi:MAG: tetratricopeptide repeat protein [Candidatus Nitricoxidivorans perseverans]|uniref:Tetratricopeptide repeat protein n=1 Tax=Candidatus Nitricoxidivorans perseverans TaxID=2975601 RepID=A0AA49FIY6_9PROT|nr:MAG: tetratricopeptide repeat protein [Candidatus Nitricoxidivorans perseverans]
MLRLPLLIFALAFFLGTTTTRAAAPDLGAADRMVRAGKAEEAWLLLSPHEFDLAGREDFDYLLGVAALDSGRADRATLIFERVLAVNPNHAAARLDMARAYFALGDFDRSRIEFEAVLRFDPPPPARATIERYLAEISARSSLKAVRLAGYAELTWGSDSNLNAATTGGSFYFPLFNATVTSANKRSDYFAAGAGGDLAWPLHEKLDLLAGLDYRQRVNDKEWVDGTLTRRTDFYDTRDLGVRVGLQYRHGPRDALRLMLSRTDTDLNDTELYRRNQGLTAEWRRTVDSRHQFSVFAMDQRSRYGRVENTDYGMYGGDQTIIGIGGVRIVDPARSAFAYASLYGGGERATDKAAGNLDGDKRIGGFKLGGQVGLRPDIDLSGSFGVLTTRYQLTNTLFLARRDDFVMDLTLAAPWRFRKDWQLKPQYVYTRSDSNFGAYDYARHDFSLTLRYDFR